MSYLSKIIKELNPQLDYSVEINGFNTYISFKNYPDFKIREYDTYKSPDVLIYATKDNKQVFYKAIPKKEYSKINLYKTVREILTLMNNDKEVKQNDNRFTKIAQQSAFDPGYQPEASGDITSLIRALRSHAETLQNIKRQNDWHLSVGYTGKLIKQINDMLLAAVVYNSQKKNNPLVEKQNPLKENTEKKDLSDIQKRIKEIMDK